MIRSILLSASVLFLLAGAAFAQDDQSAIETRFKKLDANSDGKLDKSEFAGKNDKNIDRRFARADANSDGSVSMEEFTAFAKRAAANKKKK